MLEWGSAVWVALAGLLIGATGIGGVLVVPVLVGLEGMDPAKAVAASALAFAFPGAVALWRAKRLHRPVQGNGSAPWLWVLVCCAGAGAVLGAWGVHHMDTTGLLAVLAVLALASGWRAWHVPTETPLPPRVMGPVSGGLLGGVVGVGSGLTGTGGPVLLVPLLMALRQPLPQVVWVAQMVQLPVALSAGGAHAASGGLDTPLALVLGAWLVVGALGGQWLALRLPIRHLPRLVALLLVGTGLWMTHRVWEGWGASWIGVWS